MSARSSEGSTGQCQTKVLVLKQNCQLLLIDYSEITMFSHNYMSVSQRMMGKWIFSGGLFITWLFIVCMSPCWPCPLIAGSQVDCSRTPCICTTLKWTTDSWTTGKALWNQNGDSSLYTPVPSLPSLTSTYMYLPITTLFLNIKGTRKIVFELLERCSHAD